MVIGRYISRLDDAKDASNNSKTEQEAESDLGPERDLELVDESYWEEGQEEIKVDGDGCVPRSGLWTSGSRASC